MPDFVEILSVIFEINLPTDRYVLHILCLFCVFCPERKLKKNASILGTVAYL
jgi:hypothetical protein